MNLRVFRSTLTGAFAVALFFAMPTRTVLATDWQASVSPGVELAVRARSHAHFLADFALTSPSGSTRHARIPSDETGSAAVRFGDEVRPSPFGLPDETFSPGVSGRWTWRCRVAGVSIARGSFTISRNADGTVTTHTTQPIFGKP